MRIDLENIVVWYFIIINIISFIQMGIDKKRAKEHKWRIKEKTLFLFAAIGGSIGSIAGMRCFKHKTKHIKFIIGMPLLLLLQIILGFVIFRFTDFRF